MNEFISVIKVTPKDNYNLLLSFDTGEQKLFDMTPYLDKGIFQKLKNGNFFKTARIGNDTVIWGNGEIDMSPDTLYLKSNAVT